MKEKSFFGFLLLIAAIILSVTSCADYDFFAGNDPDPMPDGKKVTLVDGSLDIKHDWKYSNTLVSDVVTSMALLDVEKDGETRTEEINQLLPFEIKWSQPEEMSRGTKVFTLQDQTLGKAMLKASENNDNITLKSYEQNFVFDFDGMQISFETSYQTATSKYEGIDLANCILDEIKYVSQKAETVEKFFIGDRAYIRSKVTFTFEVNRHHTHDNSKHTDYLYPYVYVNAPESVDPEEDIFNGAIIIGGTEKLFFNRKLNENTYIYTSQVDVWEFWSVSGKKRVTYSTELEIKHWIDDEKEAWIVPSVEIGYPNLKEVRTKTSSDYVKENISDYVFQKTTSDWSADWQYSNNYNIGVYGSSERAWKTYKGMKIVAMPYDTHKFAYDKDKYSYGNYTQKVSDGITYLSYPAKVYFDATYNGDIYVLNQDQEFWVEEGSVNPPTPDDELISEKILYELENNNGKWISKIIFRRKYSISGERDSVALQELIRKTKVDEDKQFIRENNTLNLKNMLDPVKVSENTETDQTTGHVITTIVNKHAFDFDFFTFNIEETYQTAYTMYKGERLNFLAPTPDVVLSGQTSKDMGQISTQDGAKYNRTEYTLNYKETYGDFVTMYYPLVDIDVLDNSKPDTDDIVNWSYDRERNGFTSKVILHITRKLSGTKDSTLVAQLSHSHQIADKQLFYCNDEALSLADATPNVSTQEETLNGITYVTTTTRNRFRYNISNIDGNPYYDEVTTIDKTAYMNFQGTRIDFLAPETSQISYSGSQKTQKGQVIRNGQTYNLVTYTHTYKELYDGNNETLNNEVDLYVKKEAERISWQALNKGFDYVSDTQWRSYFTLNERFSDGSEKNTNKEVYLNIYGQAPAKRNLQLNSAEFDYTSLTPKATFTSTRSGGENITVTTLQTPYELVYTNSANEVISSEFVFVSETAVYRDGDIVVDFLSGNWSNISNTGYSAPLQGQVGDYDRYNASFNITGQYNGYTYPVSALVDIDVLRNLEPDTPDPWGDLDVEKTLAYGGLAWSWRNEGGNAIPFVTLTVVTEYGIVSAWEGGECFTEVNTNTITGRLSNSLYTEGTNYLIPSYISIPTDPNKHWVYTDINGKTRDSVAGSYIVLLKDVTIDEPFIADGGEVVTNASYTVNGKHVKVTYRGKVLFEHTFPDVVK